MTFRSLYPRAVHTRYLYSALWRALYEQKRDINWVIMKTAGQNSPQLYLLFAHWTLPLSAVLRCSLACKQLIT